MELNDYQITVDKGLADGIKAGSVSASVCPSYIPLNVPVHLGCGMRKPYQRRLKTVYVKACRHVVIDNSSVMLDHKLLGYDELKTFCTRTGYSTLNNFFTAMGQRWALPFIGFLIEWDTERDE